MNFDERKLKIHVKERDLVSIKIITEESFKVYKSRTRREKDVRNALRLMSEIRLVKLRKFNMYIVIEIVIGSVLVIVFVIVFGQL